MDDTEALAALLDDAWIGVDPDSLVRGDYWFSVVAARLIAAGVTLAPPASEPPADLRAWVMAKATHTADCGVYFGPSGLATQGPTDSRCDCGLRAALSGDRPSPEADPLRAALSLVRSVHGPIGEDEHVDAAVHHLSHAIGMAALSGDHREPPADLRAALAHVRQALKWHKQGTRPTGISVELLAAIAALSGDRPSPHEHEWMTDTNGGKWCYDCGAVADRPSPEADHQHLRVEGSRICRCKWTATTKRSPATAPAEGLTTEAGRALWSQAIDTENGTARLVPHVEWIDAIEAEARAEGYAAGLAAQPRLPDDYREGYEAGLAAAREAMESLPNETLDVRMRFAMLAAIDALTPKDPV